MRMRIKDRSELERQSKDFLAFARFYLSNAFPNPDRQGCPPDDALRSLAVNPKASEVGVSEHISNCSPCFNRYSELLTEVKLRIGPDEQISWKWILGWFRAHPRLVGAALACILLIAIGVEVLWIRFRLPNPPPLETKQPSTVQSTNPEVAYSPFALDLSNISPIRGSKPPIGVLHPVELPRAPLDLTLSLPLGSEEQAYSVRLRAASHAVWAKAAQAHLSQGRILIRIQADFRQVPAGDYNLEVESPAGIRLVQPVSIRDTSPTGTGQ
jgi:hypothetical protein